MSQFRTGLIIQARNNSTRLPNKVTLSFYKKKTILELIIKNLLLETNLPIIVATTNHENDDEIVQIAKECGVDYYRGDNENVLKRFVGAAEEFELDNVVRVCSDNPFISAEYINYLMEEFITEKNDYLSYEAGKGTPSILSHWGFFCEMFSLEALYKIESSLADNFDKEHVTRFMYNNPTLFKVKFIKAKNSIFKREDIRLTVDDQQDFDNMKLLYFLVKNEGEDVVSIDRLVNLIEQNTRLHDSIRNQINKQVK